MKIVQTFKQYLSESQYKVEVDDVFKVFRNNCQEFLAGTPSHPLVRGMTLSETPLIIHGEAGSRTSANTENYYTIFLDHTLPPLGYPKRSKSIICGNWDNKGYAESFGDIPFAIIPFDGVKIGVCPGFDMWETRLPADAAINKNNGPRSLKIDNLNNAMKRVGVPETTFAEIVKYIEGLFDIADKELDSDKRYLIQFFNKGKVKENLEEAYSEKMGFELETPRTINSINRRRELWIGGKCLAIPLAQYAETLNEFLNQKE